MTFGAVVGLLFALALVLGLFGLAIGAARRFAQNGGAAGGLRMTVLQRTALGPRQGLAAVRVGERVLLLGVGEGGVRLVTELAAEESAALDAAAPQRGPSGVRAAPRGLWAPLRKALGLAPVLVLLTVLFAEPVAALQAAGAGGTASGSPPAVDTRAVLSAAAAAVQQQGTPPRLNLQLGGGSDSDLRISGTVGTVLFIGLLALLPTLLLLMTSFTRVLIVLHFLRQALGTQNAPPGHLLTALALMLTGYIMAPTLGEVNTAAIQPWLNGQMDEGQMMSAGVAPFRAFMLQQTPEDDLARFVELSGQPLPDAPEDVSLPVLMSAFATSELRAAFQMGFALFLPFVVIDIVVSAVLTSMGMFMLPPTMIALPCKLLLFVLVDGWSLLVGSLVASFG